MVLLKETWKGTRAGVGLGDFGDANLHLPRQDLEENPLVLSCAGPRTDAGLGRAARFQLQVFDRNSTAPSLVRRHRTGYCRPVETTGLPRSRLPEMLGRQPPKTQRCRFPSR